MEPLEHGIVGKYVRVLVYSYLPFKCVFKKICVLDKQTRGLVKDCGEHVNPERKISLSKPRQIERFFDFSYLLSLNPALKLKFKHSSQHAYLEVIIDLLPPHFFHDQRMTIKVEDFSFKRLLQKLNTKTTKENPVRLKKLSLSLTPRDDGQAVDMLLSEADIQLFNLAHIVKLKEIHILNSEPLFTPISAFTLILDRVSFYNAGVRSSLLAQVSDLLYKNQYVREAFFTAQPKMLENLEQLCLHNVGLFNAEYEEYRASLKIFKMTCPTTLRRLILRFPSISAISQERVASSKFIEDLSLLLHPDMEELEIQMPEVEVSIDADIIHRITSRVEKTHLEVLNAHIQLKLDSPLSSLTQKVSVHLAIDFLIQKGPKNSTECSFFNSNRAHVLKVVCLKPE